jgi:predicted  nucleic acid-binding Zn-ribbon protein
LFVSVSSACSDTSLAFRRLADSKSELDRTAREAAELRDSVSKLQEDVHILTLELQLKKEFEGGREPGGSSASVEVESGVEPDGDVEQQHESMGSPSGTELVGGVAELKEEVEQLKEEKLGREAEMASLRQQISVSESNYIEKVEGEAEMASLRQQISVSRKII